MVACGGAADDLADVQDEVVVLVVAAVVVERYGRRGDDALGDREEGLVEEVLGIATLVCA